MRTSPFGIFMECAWKVWSGQRHCLNSLQGLCRRQNPQQLSVSEQEIIRAGCANKEYENWPLNSIYYQMLRERKINCCQSTFYKYCRLLNITRKPIKRPKKYIPFVADKALTVLHQDITIFRTINGIKHYIYVIDNFSRAILACKGAIEYNSEMARQTLEEYCKTLVLWIRKEHLLLMLARRIKGDLTNCSTNLPFSGRI